MTDHSSGHTEEWESLTPLEGPHQSVGKLCPARAWRANVLSLAPSMGTTPAVVLTGGFFRMRGGGLAQGPWWLALLACGGAIGLSPLNLLL